MQASERMKVTLAVPSVSVAPTDASEAAISSDEKGVDAQAIETTEVESKRRGPQQDEGIETQEKHAIADIKSQIQRAQKDDRRKGADQTRASLVKAYPNTTSRSRDEGSQEPTESARAGVIIESESKGVGRGSGGSDKKAGKGARFDTTTSNRSSHKEVEYAREKVNSATNTTCKL